MVLKKLSVIMPPQTRFGLSEQGVVFGTTIDRAIAMAREAGLALSLVRP
jgi:hypothetical protein